MVDVRCAPKLTSVDPILNGGEQHKNRQILLPCRLSLVCRIVNCIPFGQPMKINI